MGKRVIYVAGAYKSRTEWGLEKNLRQAEDAAMMLWDKGWVVICPHKNTAHFGGALGIPDSVWLEGDVELLRRSDAIFMLNGWLSSEGACHENRIAKELGLEIYHEGGIVPSV